MWEELEVFRNIERISEAEQNLLLGFICCRILLDLYSTIVVVILPCDKVLHM